MAEKRDAYEAWIREYVLRNNNFVRGKCFNACTEMQAAFPELSLVRGHVECSWGRDAHWWLVDPSGAIVDPTRAQFDYVLEYDPLKLGDPVRVGKCTECGEIIWAKATSLETMPPPKSFCSEACELSFCREG